MKYYLVYYNDLEITKITGFNKFDDTTYNENSLKDIIKFTSQFNNEQELIDYLIYTRAINYKKDSHLAIGTYSKELKKIQILPYGIPFINDIKYFNFNILNNFYLNHLTDKNFMKLFFDNFFRVEECKPIIIALYNKYKLFLNTGLLPLDSKYLMNEFLIKYITTKTLNGYKKSFHKLRDLAMFAINYIREKNLKEQEIILNANDYNEIKDMILHYEFLLQDSDLSKEGKEAYENALETLKHNLDIYNLQKGRGK